MRIAIIIDSMTVQSKCAHYWPDAGQIKELEGGMKLTHLKETVNTDFTLREFLLMKDGHERIIYQYHFNVSKS